MAGIKELDSPCVSTLLPNHRPLHTTLPLLPRLDAVHTRQVKLKQIIGLALRMPLQTYVCQMNAGRAPRLRLAVARCRTLPWNLARGFPGPVTRGRVGPFQESPEAARKPCPQGLHLGSDKGLRHMHCDGWAGPSGAPAFQSGQITDTARH